MKLITYLQNWQNAHQLEILFICIVIALIAMDVFKQELEGKRFTKYGIIASNLYMLAIFYVTIFSRQKGQELSYNYEIFWSYRLALRDMGYLEEIWLNILLFTPLGVIWASINRKGKVYWYFLIVIMGTVVSCCIEALQYYLQCGFSETDDVLSNVIGIALGILLWNCVQRKYGEKDEI